MHLDHEKPFYFEFFARDIESEKTKPRGKIMMYIRTDVKAEIYVLKTSEDDLLSPSESNSTWKSSIGGAGGLTAIEILPTDPNYCLNC